MALTLKNTLTKTTEEFTPLSGKTVTLYNCGPTVYSFPHIGNLRAYIFADTIKRALKGEGYKVKQIINITDVGHLTSDEDEGEDKMEVGARREKKSAKEIAEFYTKAFLKDLKKLNADTKGTKFPRATKHIKEQIALIQKLEEKGYIYKTSDGVYFDSSKFEGYGKLGSVNIKGLQEGARIEKNPEKKHPTDFAVWKFSPRQSSGQAPQVKREQEWKSPWGIGFPGWHIECSAMAMKYLGETLDIHTGGIDHIPTHHNNEIAQSESATGKQFARFWIHSAHLMVDQRKIAKSLGNVFYLSDVEEKGIHPLSLRYFFLGASYDTQMNFTWESLHAADSAYKKLLGNFAMLKKGWGKPDSNYLLKFKESFEDNLNTPRALSVLWELMKDREVKDKDKRATILLFDKVLGLDIESNSNKQKKELFSTSLPREITELFLQREALRKNKEWEKADEVRKEIEAAGYTILDSEKGGRVIKK